MYHGFDLSDGIGVDVQQAVYDSQFLFRLGALPHPYPVAIRRLHLCRNNDLCLGYPHDFAPSYVGVLLQLQPVLGDGHNPVSQHGQVQVRLDAAVSLVVDWPYVEVALENLKGLMGSFP